MLSKKSSIPLFALSLLMLSAPPVQAAVDTSTLYTLHSTGTPVDTTTSADGRWFFVLTSQGQVEIYGVNGSLQDTIKLENPADHISASPTGDELFLSNKATGAITVMAVTFVQEINITGAPFRGPEKAPVTVVVFSDFQCPFCARVEPLLEQVLKLYPKEVKVVFKNFPLQIHQFSLPAAVAALAAQRQGKFWEMHDKIFENYNTLNTEKFTEFAKTLGLNMERFTKDSNDPAIQQQVKNDLQDGIKADVRGTPSLFVNGRRLNDRSLDGFKAMIDAELKKSKK